MGFEVRAINLLIDSTVFLIFVFASAFILRDFVEIEDFRVLMILIYYLYYFISETITGQTVGKMFTQTKVVGLTTNEKPKVLNILLRTALRLVPLEFISFLFYQNGFHDRFSKTKLVYK
ncbi:RDD family protein [Rhodonellum sp.]|uniref:RDD family protein n=1 Tax=Rhodonellum sp. TaxID=2231180 RepID=UPI00351E1E6F